jgi:hypothetical protein
MKRPMVIVLIVGLVGVLVVPPVIVTPRPDESGSTGQPKPPKEKVALM